MLHYELPQSIRNFPPPLPKPFKGLAFYPSTLLHKPPVHMRKDYLHILLFRHIQFDRKPRTSLEEGFPGRVMQVIQAVRKCIPQSPRAGKAKGSRWVGKRLRISRVTTRFDSGSFCTVSLKLTCRNAANDIPLPAERVIWHRLLS